MPTEVIGSARSLLRVRARLPARAMSAGCQLQTLATLFDHPAGRREQIGRHAQAENPGGLHAVLATNERAPRHVSNLPQATSLMLSFLAPQRPRVTVIDQSARVTCLAESLNQSFGDLPPVRELLIARRSGFATGRRPARWSGYGLPMAAHWLFPFARPPLSTPRRMLSLLVSAGYPTHTRPRSPELIPVGIVERSPKY
jgi:hypothetical protein